MLTVAPLTTMQDVHAEIISQIQAGADYNVPEYDLDAIARAAYTYTPGRGWFPVAHSGGGPALDADNVDGDLFWSTVEDCRVTFLPVDFHPAPRPGSYTAVVRGFSGWEVARLEVNAPEGLTFETAVDALTLQGWRLSYMGERFIARRG